ncbi:MAG TPA: hypothetical protein VN281_03930 [Verrucomicrobiae bacterium]|nr:hypothetical protein [Verrucomicrobiae bacterium]
MNRSILIVICDFLLVSLLAFSTVDVNKLTENGTVHQGKLEMVTNQVDSGKDLAAAMRIALDEERRNRDQLQGQLAIYRDQTSRQEALLNEREKQVQSVKEQLQTRDQEARQLQQQQADLQNQLAGAQTNLQTLNQQLQNRSTETLLSKEKLAAMEAEAKKQSDAEAALEQQLSQLSKSNQMVLAEKQQLSTQLQVAEAEKRSATEQAVRMQEEVKVEREEKAKLAEGVKVLATKSSELATEVRENRPLAANTIFNQLNTNRVQASFTASRSGFFGNEATRRKVTQTVLVSDGTNTFALCHVQDTPLTLWNPGTEWESLSGSLSGNASIEAIHSISFHLQDPRVVLMPVTRAEAAELGCKAFRISSDPYKFQDAVLVGTRESYYGECGFQIDTSTPDYVKLDRSLLKGLFGKFNPSSGDLVFSKTGDLVGIMVNGTYCMLVHNLEAAATFQFGPDVKNQHTGFVLSQLYSSVSQLPFKLQ